MKSVGIDVSMVPKNPIGAGRYILELVGHLKDHERSFKIKLFSRSDDRARWEQLLNQDDQIANVLPNSRPLRLAYENLLLKRDLREINLLHSPHYTVPMGLKIPLIVNIHDLIFFENPGFHQIAKVAYFKNQIKTAVNRADVIICGTDYIKNKIENRFNPKGAVKVVPYGVNIKEFEPSSKKDLADTEILMKLNVDFPYLLYVGTIEPRKKVDELIKAFRLLVSKNLVDQNLKLLLVGKFGWKCESVKELLQQYDDNRIVQAGYLDQKYVPSLFRRATAVIYPSQTEGFGLPVLEAMAARSPVITTSGSVMEHFAKDSATYFQSGDIEDLSAKILQITTGYCESFKLDIGSSIASEFSWINSTRKHIELYESIL